MDLKSLVWYSPEQFEDNGYEVPSTMEELIALSDQMVVDGNTPWCIGIESGNATGWTATDWMEDIMLRTTSAENYDRWVSNELPFNSPEVINAMNIFGQFSKNDDYVAGGASSVATTSTPRLCRFSLFEIVVKIDSFSSEFDAFHFSLVGGQ